MKEERLERLAAVWDECESSGVKLGPSGFDESNHEQRNAFLPLADEDEVRSALCYCVYWCRKFLPLYLIPLFSFVV